MGFTGLKAVQFKIAYVEAFNQMEASIRGMFTAQTRHSNSTTSDFPDWPLEELRTKGMIVNMYHKLHGVRGGNGSSRNLDFQFLRMA